MIEFKNNILVYVDTTCTMYTVFGDWANMSCRDISVISNTKLPAGFSDVVRKTIIVYDPTRGEIYTKFFAILRILKNHNSLIVRVASSVTLAAFCLVTLEPFYNFISKNRLLFFKNKDACEILPPE